jgi:hypothetical protein
MKRIILLLVFCISILGSFAQLTCKCSAFLSIDNHTKIPIVFLPTGDTTYIIQNDSSNQFTFEILRQDVKYFLVVPSNTNPQAERQVLDTGWIHSSYLKIFARNYSSTLTLYQDATTNSAPKTTIKEFFPDEYQILKCKKDWLYVRLQKNNVTYEGWMSPEMQCDNPYTTCN